MGGHQRRVWEVPLAVLVNTKIIVPVRITVMWVFWILYCFFFLLCALYYLFIFNLLNKVVLCFCCNCLCIVGKTNFSLFMSPFYIEGDVLFTIYFSVLEVLF